MAENKFCIKCGAELDDEVQFCSSCGTKVNAKPEQESQSRERSQLEKQQTTGRLAVLLVPPFVSIAFSLLALILHAFPDDNNVIGIIKGSFVAFSSVTGAMALLIGTVVLISQLIKSNIHVKNILYFVAAYFLSVIVFVVAIAVMQ